MKYIKFSILIVTILFFLKPLLSQEVETLEFTHGPYLQNMTETGVTIVFTTNKLVVPGIMIELENDEFVLVQNSKDGLLNVGDNLHKVRIEGLKPGQKYHYKLFAKEIIHYRPYKVEYGDSLISKVFQLTTFDNRKSPINFTVFCDIHDKAAKLGKYLESNNIEKQDLYFLNGDIMGHIEEENQLFSSFLDTCVSRFATEKPFFYVRGNHETRGKFARELRNYLDLEGNEYYYAKTIGKTRFVVLDGGEDKPDSSKEYSGLVNFDQYRKKGLDWLKNEVESTEFKNTQFKIVVIHMPIIKRDKNWYGMAFLAEHFGPVLEKAGVDLMICGHTHSNQWVAKEESGFGYPVLICSNNDYIEASVGKNVIKIDLKNLEGDIVKHYSVEKRNP